MNNDYLELKLQAEKLLNQMSIMDGDAIINNILFELKESDDTNLEIKRKTLEAIKDLLNIKRTIAIKNNDLFCLRTLAEQLRLDESSNVNTFSLIKVINSQREEKYFITLKSANDYINLLENKNEIEIQKIDILELKELLNIIKRNF